MSVVFNENPNQSDVIVYVKKDTDIYVLYRNILY